MIETTREAVARPTVILLVSDHAPVLRSALATSICDHTVAALVVTLGGMVVVVVVVVELIELV